MTNPLRYSILSLLLANALPLVGVLFFDWNIFQILFLYWLESAIVGFFHVIKLGVIGRIGYFSLIFIPFFIILYGLFMSAHLSFILNFFARFSHETYSFPTSLESFKLYFNAVVIPFCGIFISHGISFFKNFIGKKEYSNYTQSTIIELVKAPYAFGRIVVMQITVILGGFMAVILQEPIWVLVLLIILKSVIDLKYHIKEHTTKER